MIKSLFFISLPAMEVDVKARRTKLSPEPLVFAGEASGTTGVNNGPDGMKTDSQGRRAAAAAVSLLHLMRDGVYGPPPVPSVFH